MYDLFTELMAGFSPDQPLQYLLGWLSFVVLCGVFFRLLYSLFKPY